MRCPVDLHATQDLSRRACLRAEKHR
jgi:hypothetical protein